MTQFKYVYGYGQWAPGFLEVLPGLKEQISLLPYEKLNFVATYEQKPGDRVSPHTDAYIHVGDNAPPTIPVFPGSDCAGFRMWLVNDEPDTTFYVRLEKLGDDAPMISPKWKEPVIGSWWNFASMDKQIIHGARNTKHTSRKIILVVGGTLDQQEHTSNLYRWIDKYPEYLIWKNDSRFIDTF